MNPVAVVFWLFCAGVSWLVFGSLKAAIAGAVFGLFISLLGTILPSGKRR